MIRLQTKPMPATVRAATYTAGTKGAKRVPAAKVGAAKVSVMAVFPAWVEKPRRQPPIELARKRLRYLISKTMLEKTETGSQTEIAQKCGIGRATISNFIAYGKFSLASAKRFERAYGKEWIPYEWLLEPLDIA